MSRTSLNGIKDNAKLGLTGSVAVSDSETGDPVNVSQTKTLWFAAENNGASTDLSVVLYGKPTATSTITYPISTLNLNATTTDGAKYIENPPQFLLVKVINNDASNATTYNVSLDLRR